MSDAPSNWHLPRWTDAEDAIIRETLDGPPLQAWRSIQAINPTRTRKAVRDRRLLILGRRLDMIDQPWVRRLLVPEALSL